ncbi:MAG: outer membrane protein assembly factor BamD [Myxococcota bacterium]
MKNRALRYTREALPKIPWQAARGIAVLTIALLCACATAPPEEELPSAESYYQRGVKLLEGRRVFLFFNDVDYPKAIESFQEVIDNYPYSEYSLLSELAIADIHYEREEYDEASSYYHDFVELHPNHAKVAYALYRNGLCSYNQMRAADRDQAATREAAAQFRALLERFPASDMTEDAKARLAECENRLALQGIEIGDFYFSQRDWHAAARRYRVALSQFPSHQDRARTMVYLGVSLARLHRYGEAESALRRALELGPDEELRDSAELELDQLANLPLYGPRVLPKSCVTDPNPSCPKEVQ